jgi:hypothetical protein
MGPVAQEGLQAEMQVDAETPEHLLMEDTMLQFSCSLGYVCVPVAMTEVRIPQGAPELSAARQFLQYQCSEYGWADGGDQALWYEVYSDGGDEKAWRRFVHASLGHILEEMRQPVENQAEIDAASVRLLRESGDG